MFAGRKSSYRDLDVWRRACELAVGVYRLTEAYPGKEMYGLTAQMRRCATSVPANIAEGKGRRSDGDFIRFPCIAAGSLAELETFLETSRRLHYGEEQLLS
ncbi:MAG: four helix bundle protein [Armatimonadota bacterium]